MTHASLRFPEVVEAIQKIAFTRPHGFLKSLICLCSLMFPGITCAYRQKLPWRTWFIAFAESEGGQLWVKSPVGSHALATAKCQ